MTSHTIDLRSDTVTLPTDEMYDSMRAAPLGDDNIRDDPTIHKLEALAAQVTGHEAALFCPTGTMANLLGTRLHTKPGDGVVMPRELNMYRYGVVAWNSLQPIFVDSERGYPAAGDLARAIEYGLKGETPPPLVVIEAPHNYFGGCLTTPDYLAEARDVAHRYGLAFFLDGARLFNLAVAAGRPAAHFASQADMTMFCLSKGLSAPVGSMLCGKREAIERGTKVRFLMGGAMRQAGLLAACGIYALTHLVERLAEDHSHARSLAAAAGRWPQVRVNPSQIDTNMVFFDLEKAGLTAGELCDKLRERNVLAGAVGMHRARFVTHRGITADDIEKTIAALDAVLSPAARRV